MNKIHDKQFNSKVVSALSWCHLEMLVLKIFLRCVVLSCSQESAACLLLGVG